MKRFIIFLTVICLMLTIISFHGFAAEETINMRSVELMQAMGVLDNTDLTFLSANVSRAEFMVYILKLIDMTDYEVREKRYFKDLSKNSWAAPAVAYLCEAGIIEYDENRMFYPDAAITETDAAEIILKLAGYKKFVEYSDKSYQTLAKEYKLIGNINGKFTVSEMAEMFEETVSLPMCKAVIDGVPQSSGGDTFLGVYRNLYKKEGRVTAADGISFFSSDAVAADMLRVDDEEFYEGSINSYDYLGNYVDIYYEKAKGDTTGTVVYMFEAAKNKYLVIDFDDIISCSTGLLLRYYKNDKAAVLNIPQNILAVNNGCIVKSELNKAFENKKGTVKFIYDSGIIKYAVLDTYENMIATGTDEEQKIYYSSYTGFGEIDLSKFEHKEIRYSDGETADITDITKDTVITVYASENRIRIYINNEVVSGIVTAVKEHGGDTVIAINGDEYVLDKDFLAFAEKHGLKVGVEAMFKQDISGKIVYMQESAKTEYRYGFVVGCSYDEFIDDMKLKLFESNGSFDVLSVDGSVCFDGERIKPDKAYSRVVGADGKIKNMLIRYGINSAGKINFIDTPDTDAYSNEANSLFVSAELKDRIYMSTSKSFGMTLPIGENTVVMKVPSDGTIALADDKDYSIPKTFESYKSYKVEGYSTDKKNIFPDIILLKQETDDKPEIYPYIVDNVYNAVDGEGTVYSGVRLGGINGIEDLKIADDFVVTDEQRASGYISYAELENGDTIRIARNTKGEISKIYLIIDYNKDRSINTTRLNQYGNYWTYDCMNFGYVKKTDGNYFRYGQRETDENDEIIYISSSIVVFDSANKKESVRVGDIDDIKSAETSGDDCSAILTTQRNGSSRITIVYKNGSNIFKGE